MPRPPDDAELHAYTDDRLPSERQADIAAWLRAHPAQATRITFVFSLSGLIGWHARSVRAFPEPKPMADAVVAYRLFAEHDLALEFRAGAITELEVQGWHLRRVLAVHPGRRGGDAGV